MRLVFLLFFFLFLKGNVSLKNFSISADRSLKNLKTGLTVFEDNVNISFGDIKMKTQKATFNYLKKTFYTEGLTIISNPSFSVKTKEKVEGDVNKKTYRVGKVEGNFEEWIFLADNFLFDGNVVKLKGANLSPCLDFTNKLNAYYIRNKEIIYDYEKEEAVLKGIWLYLYKVPILYLPYLKLDLSNLGLPFRFSTGYRESWGAYGKLKLKLSDSKDSKTSILLEARSKRGALLGAEYEMKKKHYYQRLSYYFAYDKEADFDSISPQGEHLNGRFKSKSDKYLLEWDFFYQLKSSLIFQAKVNFFNEFNIGNNYLPKLKDNYPQAFSFFNILFLGDIVDFSLSYRPRLNSFYSVITEQPNLSFSSKKIRIFDTDFYFQTEGQLGMLAMKFREFDDGGENADSYKSFRLSSTNSLFWNLKKFSWLNFLPYTSFRWNYYNRSSKTELNKKQINKNFLLDDPFVASNDSFLNYSQVHQGVKRSLWESGVKISTLLVKQFFNKSYTHYVKPMLNFSYQRENSSSDLHQYFFTNDDLHQNQTLLQLALEQKLSKSFLDKKQREIFFIQTYLNILLKSSFLDKQEIVFNNYLRSNFLENFIIQSYCIFDLDNYDIQWEIKVDWSWSKSINSFIHYYRSSDDSIFVAPSLAFASLGNQFQESGLIDFQKSKNITLGLNYNISDNIRLRFYLNEDLLNHHTSAFNFDTTIYTQCIDYHLGASQSENSQDIDFSFSLGLKHLKF